MGQTEPPAAQAHSEPTRAPKKSAARVGKTKPLAPQAREAEAAAGREATTRRLAVIRATSSCVSHLVPVGDRSKNEREKHYNDEYEVRPAESTSHDMTHLFYLCSIN